MPGSHSICPLCQNEKSTATEDLEYDRLSVACPRCGKYVVERDVVEDFIEQGGKPRKFIAQRPRMSALTREQDVFGLPPFYIQHPSESGQLRRLDGHYPIAFEELLERWPETVPARLDRALVLLSRAHPRPGSSLGFHAADFLPFVFAENADEAMYMRDALAELGWVVRHDSSTQAGGVPLPSLDFVISPRGWNRVGELVRGQACPGKPSLAAMWFDSSGSFTPSMKAVFEHGLRAGARAAGYDTIRVDLDSRSNDGIMDEVIARIRESPFVLADFTANRNGIYFEAGFERGLGKPVIHTCHRDSFDDAHFDIRHLNTIVWAEIDELRNRVSDRILGNLPRGHYKP